MEAGSQLQRTGGRASARGLERLPVWVLGARSRSP